MKYTVPAGYALVPIEPTPEMRDAGGMALYGHPRSSAVEWAKEDKFDGKADQAEDAYRAMIRAAAAMGKASQSVG